jgi:hypothetical protein
MQEFSLLQNVFPIYLSHSRWVTLIFWLIDNLYTVSGKSLIATSPNLMMTLRNFIGAGIAVASSVVAASHNVYHKIRVNGI